MNDHDQCSVVVMRVIVLSRQVLTLNVNVSTLRPASKLLQPCWFDDFSSDAADNGLQIRIRQTECRLKRALTHRGLLLQLGDGLIGGNAGSNKTRRFEQRDDASRTHGMRGPHEYKITLIAC